MKVFGVDYRFLACGDVFTMGLEHAATALGLSYRHAAWDAHDLAAQITRFDPDLLFVVHGRKFARRFPTRITRGRMAVWLLDEPYEVDDTAVFSKQFDTVYINDPQTLHRHHAASYLPVCYDPIVQWNPGSERPYVVGFIGGGNRTRERYLRALAEAGVLSYVVGGPWQDPRIRQVCRAPNIPARETAALYQRTQIIINVFREQHHYNAQKIPAVSLNPRVYEGLACGALVVSEWRPECESLIPELPTFRSVDECLTLVQSLIADPVTAESIRQSCLARIAPHTYAARLQTVCQTVGVTVAA